MIFLFYVDALRVDVVADAHRRCYDTFTRKRLFQTRDDRRHVLRRHRPAAARCRLLHPMLIILTAFHTIRPPFVDDAFLHFCLSPLLILAAFRC